MQLRTRRTPASRLYRRLKIACFVTRTTRLRTESAMTTRRLLQSDCGVLRSADANLIKPCPIYTLLRFTLRPTSATTKGVGRCWLSGGGGGRRRWLGGVGDEWSLEKAEGGHGGSFGERSVKERLYIQSSEGADERAPTLRPVDARVSARSSRGTCPSYRSASRGQTGFTVPCRQRHAILSRTSGATLIRGCWEECAWRPREREREGGRER